MARAYPHLTSYEAEAPGGEAIAGEESVEEERSAGEVKEIGERQNLEDGATERYEKLALQYGVHARVEDAKVFKKGSVK